MLIRNWRYAVLGALALTAFAACEGDDDDAAGSRPVQRAGGSTPSRQSEAEDFIVACWNESDHECTERLGEETQRAVIEAENRRTCRLGGNVVQTTRCSTDQSVGSCRTYVKLDNVRTPIDDYYYPPLTEADGRTLCQGEHAPPSHASRLADEELTKR